ncbi:inorganic phosphate transporter, partial [Staphylococcus aureus]
EAEARTLAERFEQAFWCEELGTYAIALDGRKRPCKVRTSNAGQVLFSGMIREDQLSPDIFPPIIFAGLIGAITWNMLTWLLGLPSSSSHALFGGL